MSEIIIPSNSDSKKTPKSASFKFDIYLLGGVIGGLIVILVGIVVLVFFCNPYNTKPIFIEHDKALIYESKELVTNYDVKISSEMQMLFEKLKEQRVILTPHEYTSQLGSYYNSLIAVLVGLFVIFSLVSFFSMKGIAKNEVKEAQLELDKKSAEIDQVIKEEIKKILDEMLRDSKLMQEKLDKSITGLINDALEDTKNNFPTNETFENLQETVELLRNEHETLLEMFTEIIDGENVKSEIVNI